MAITRLPSRSDDSLGRLKQDIVPAPNLSTHIVAGEYNALVDAVIDVATTIGLADGSTPLSIEARLAAVIARANGHESRIAALEAEANALSVRVSDVERLAPTVAGFDVRLKKVEALGERMDAIEGEIQGILSSLTDVWGEFDNVNARVTGAEQTAGQAAADAQDAIGRVVSVEASQSAVIQTVSQLGVRVDTAEALVGTFDERISGLEERAAILEGVIGAPDGSEPGTIFHRLKEIESIRLHSGPFEEGLERGDLVCVVSSGLYGRADPLNPKRMPAIGVAIEVSEETKQATIQTGQVTPLGVYDGLIPGAVYRVGRGGRPETGPIEVTEGEEFIEQKIGIAIDSSRLSLALAPAAQIWR